MVSEMGLPLSEDKCKVRDLGGRNSKNLYAVGYIVLRAVDDVVEFGFFGNFEAFF